LRTSLANLVRTVRKSRSSQCDIAPRTVWLQYGMTYSLILLNATD